MGGNMAEKEVVFVDGMRTPFGRMGGGIRDFFCSESGAIALKGLLEKTKISEKAHVDNVFAGSEAHCSRTGNPDRWITLASGLHKEA
jgi:acetyl-CoA acetyltransferase